MSSSSFEAAKKDNDNFLLKKDDKEERFGGRRCLTFLLLRETTLLNDNLVQAQLDLSSFNHLLLHRVFGEESIHHDLLLLSNAVRAILGLEIDLRVPERKKKEKEKKRKRKRLLKPKFVVQGEEEEKYYQSESYKMTMSAVARLIPKPPARVVNMKMNLSESGRLKSSIDACLSSCDV